MVVFDTVDGGQNIYRNAGWALPNDRIALIVPGQLLYNQLQGALYYASGTTIDVRPSGSVLLVASPALPGLAALVAQGYALPVATPQPIGGFRVWRIGPGSSILEGWRRLGRLLGHVGVPGLSGTGICGGRQGLGSSPRR